MTDLEKKTIKIVKPPIGLRPKWVSDKERLNEVRSAIESGGSID